MTDFSFLGWTTYPFKDLIVCLNYHFSYGAPSLCDGTFYSDLNDGVCQSLHCFFFFLVLLMWICCNKLYNTLVVTWFSQVSPAWCGLMRMETGRLILPCGTWLRWTAATFRSVVITCFVSHSLDILLLVFSNEPNSE